MRYILTILIISVIIVLSGVNANEESLKEVGMKSRSSNARNPYSWQNRVRRGMEYQFLEPEDDERIQQQAFLPMNKRAYRRNPYSWLRSAGPDSESNGFFDNLFGGVKDKKSPYMFNYGEGRRARNPYSWQNYI